MSPDCGLATRQTMAHLFGDCRAHAPHPERQVLSPGGRVILDYLHAIAFPRETGLRGILLSPCYACVASLIKHFAATETTAFRRNHWHPQPF